MEQETEAQRNYELALQDGRQEDADTFREQMTEQEAEARRAKIGAGFGKDPLTEANRAAYNEQDSPYTDAEVQQKAEARRLTDEERAQPVNVLLRAANDALERLAKAEQERDALRRGKKLADARIEELDGERYKAEQELTAQKELRRADRVIANQRERELRVANATLREALDGQAERMKGWADDAYHFRRALQQIASYKTDNMGEGFHALRTIAFDALQATQEDDSWPEIMKRP